MAPTHQQEAAAMTTDAIAVQDEFVSRLVDFRLARSPSIEIRWQLIVARAAAMDRTVLTQDQYEDALSRAKEMSRTI
jgi:hypothetical protein